jgi:hypothetical protein
MTVVKVSFEIFSEARRTLDKLRALAGMALLGYAKKKFILSATKHRNAS